MVKVTFLGQGSRTLIVGKGNKVQFKDNTAKDLPDEAGIAAKEVNKATGHMIYHVDEATPKRNDSPKTVKEKKVKILKNLKQPDVLEKMDPKRTVEDAVSDRSRGVGLE